MDHLIRFTTAEGVDGTHHAGSLEEAIAFVERLRNTEGASDVRLFRLTEVPIEFRAYYRVEVGGTGDLPDHVPPAVGARGDDAVQDLPPLVVASSSEPVGPPPVPVEAGPRLMPHVPSDPGGANGRRLFSR